MELVLTIFSSLFSLAYLAFMIYCLVQKNEQLKLAGKIMLGILITIILVPIIFFLGCVAVISFMH